MRNPSLNKHPEPGFVEFDYTYLGIFSYAGQNLVLPMIFIDETKSGNVVFGFQFHDS